MQSAGERFLPIELATAILPGTEAAPVLEPAAHGVTARQALENSLVAALTNGPCLITFSGGRDSSALLATATLVARRAGLPLPLPITLRFAADPESREDQWQEAVVRHLDLPEWTVLDLSDEIDVVGGIAQRVLSAHGLVWPPNTHFLVPAMKLAAGGTLVTGVGGDQILCTARYRRVSSIVRGRTRGTPRDLARVVNAYGPRQLREQLSRRRETPDIGWLNEQGRREFARVYAQASAEQPISWDRWVHRSWWRDRMRRVSERCLEAVAKDNGCTVTSPFEDGTFLAAIAAEQGALGFSSRTGAMEQLFSDVLPPEVLTRRTKAVFNKAFWGAQSAELAASWTGGEGVQAQFVDERRLAEEWSGEWVDGRSAWLLQQVWLARHRASQPSADSSDTR